MAHAYYVWGLNGVLKAWVKLRGGSRIACATTDSHASLMIILPTLPRLIRYLASLGLWMQVRGSPWDVYDWCLSVVRVNKHCQVSQPGVIKACAEVDPHGRVPIGWVTRQGLIRIPRFNPLATLCVGIERHVPQSIPMRGQ